MRGKLNLFHQDFVIFCDHLFTQGLVFRKGVLLESVFKLAVTLSSLSRCWDLPCKGDVHLQAFCFLLK